MSEPPLPGPRRRVFLTKYGPLLVTPFYFGFSSHILSPNTLTNWFGRQADFSVSNVLCAGSHLGVVLYLYHSKHLVNSDLFQRLLFSFYGSTMFNFGNVLIMSIVRSIFPSNPSLRLGFGLSISGVLLWIGHRYVAYIDQIINGMRFRSVSISQ